MGPEQEQFKEEEGVSRLNDFWLSFSRFYNRRKKGLQFGYQKIAGKLTVWFTYRKDF